MADDDDRKVDLATVETFRRLWRRWRPVGRTDDRSDRQGRLAIVVAKTPCGGVYRPEGETARNAIRRRGDPVIFRQSGVLRRRTTSDRDAGISVERQEKRTAKGQRHMPPHHPTVYSNRPVTYLQMDIRCRPRSNAVQLLDLLRCFSQIMKLNGR